MSEQRQHASDECRRSIFQLQDWGHFEFRATGLTLSTLLIGIVPLHVHVELGQLHNLDNSIIE